MNQLWRYQLLGLIRKVAGHANEPDKSFEAPIVPV